MFNRNRLILVKENFNGDGCKNCRFYIDFNGHGYCYLLQRISNGISICKHLILNETKLLSILNNEIEKTYFQYHIKIYSKYKCSKSCKYSMIGHFSIDSCRIFQVPLVRANNKKLIYKRCQECLDAENLFQHP